MDFMEACQYYGLDAHELQALIDNGEMCETCHVEYPCECDPTPWCSACGAMREQDCHCGPIAENE